MAERRYQRGCKAADRDPEISTANAAPTTHSNNERGSVLVLTPPAVQLIRSSGYTRRIVVGFCCPPRPGGSLSHTHRAEPRLGMGWTSVRADSLLRIDPHGGDSASGLDTTDHLPLLDLSASDTTS
eukprot:CAMPEP_0118939032 /NCGR_PEP_ID=MMETSP1169-20130426/27764_1 /TAXON_ID=36882 /ORGANISM="Pyramimonas obovata, Strain CCMP722" /LENGTH=125 /DNA_ID=CAMNT_0006883195 /DNA_START=325 /DNA_END=700 /DNA_ORIENTATION=-